MFRQEMPRVYELRDFVVDPFAPCAYFRDFDNSIRDEPSKKQAWLAREQEFQRLDLQSWQFLKCEARPYLTTWNAKRGWEQLISILNQVRAYNYLLDEGCQAVSFIPRAKTGGDKTPDLKGVLNGTKVLCEVKTINISEVEAIRRQTEGVGSTAVSLDAGFFNKLRSDVLTAKKQTESYDPSGYVRRIAFIVVSFDDFLSEYKEDYFCQTDRYLADNCICGIDIVFYNQRTAFHFQVVMQHATVVNEPG